MPTWPATLPQYVLQQGFSERLSDNIIESQMQSGPSKMRRRFTAQLRQFNITVEMTKEQALIFDTFYVTTLQSGSLSFDWVHPRTRVPTTFRFRKPPPIYTGLGSGEAVRVSFTLETLP